MTERTEGTMSPRQRGNILAGLDRMVASGRLTDDEAARIRGAEDDDAFERAVAAVRLRHAGSRIDEAVRLGTMSTEEAAQARERLGRGEHSRELRATLHERPPDR